MLDKYIKQFEKEENIKWQTKDDDRGLESGLRIDYNFLWWIVEKLIKAENSFNVALDEAIFQYKSVCDLCDCGKDEYLEGIDKLKNKIKERILKE